MKSTGNFEAKNVPTVRGVVRFQNVVSFNFWCVDSFTSVQLRFWEGAGLKSQYFRLLFGSLRKRTKPRPKIKIAIGS